MFYTTVTVNNYNYFCGHGDDSEVMALLRDIKSQGVQMHQEFLDLAKKIDEATNAVAERIDRLSGQIKNSMTDEEVAQVKAALQSEVDKLTELGKDPENPVPDAAPKP